MKNRDGYPDAESHSRLRRSARDLIDHGVSPPNHGGHIGVDALQLLYERARNPESAADAIKLLHELQTYQVELDLLYEQLQANEHEISEDLAHYRSLYDLAPAAYLIVANDGEIIEGNQAAGSLFGQPAEELAGKRLGAFLAPGEDASLITLLRTSGKQDPAWASFELPGRRWVTAHTRSATSGDSIFMILTEAPTPSADR